MPAAKKTVAKKAPPAPKKFDLDAAVREVEDDSGESKPFEFVYGEQEWTMRPADQSDAKLMSNVDLNEVQQVMVYLRDLLGEEQWADFPRITFSTALTLIEQHSEQSFGASPGESEAPTDS